jgi:hypothetical protein
MRFSDDATRSSDRSRGCRQRVVSGTAPDTRDSLYGAALNGVENNGPSLMRGRT